MKRTFLAQNSNAAKYHEPSLSSVSPRTTPRAWAWHTGHTDPACHLSHSGQPPSRNSTDGYTESQSLLLPTAFMSLLRSVFSLLLLSLQEPLTSVCSNMPEWLVPHHPTAFLPTASPVYKARKLTRLHCSQILQADTHMQDTKAATWGSCHRLGMRFLRAAVARGFVLHSRVMLRGRM